MYESDNQNVSHPSHYQGADGMEVIDVIRNFTGPHYVGYLHGNAIKYILRYEKKNGIEDLEKAIWYLTALKEYKEKEEAVNDVARDYADVINDIRNGLIANDEVKKATSTLVDEAKKAFAPLSDGYLGKV